MKLKYLTIKNIFVTTVTTKTIPTCARSIFFFQKKYMFSTCEYVFGGDSGDKRKNGT